MVWWRVESQWDGHAETEIAVLQLNHLRQNKRRLNKIKLPNILGWSKKPKEPVILKCGKMNKPNWEKGHGKHC